MGKNVKKISGNPAATKHKKTIAGEKYSSDGKLVVWRFEWLDKAGMFAFDLNRPDFCHREVLEKIIAYSNMTWTEVKRQTHDNKKSKHHFLGLSSLSSQAMERLQAKHFEEYADSVFSFALQNKLRIIGIRQDEKFYAVWFDPEHQFCPSKK